MFEKPILFSLFIALLGSTVAVAGDNPVWNGKRAAVALTYDDSLNVHLDNVIPELDRYGFKATFYITVGFAGFQSRLEDWRDAAGEGHELGNHTLFHPCRADRPDREWVPAERDLSTWTVQRMVDNLKIANIALQAVDGKRERTFAYPCGDMTATGRSYVETIKAEFVGARGVEGGLRRIDGIDLFNVNSYLVVDSGVERLTTLVDEAIERNALLVFLFHGVGGEHDLNVASENHHALLQYLDGKRDAVWVATMVDIAKHIKSYRD